MFLFDMSSNERLFLYGTYRKLNAFCMASIDAGASLFHLELFSKAS